MGSKSFHELVNEQITAEFHGSHQYAATAIYFDSIDMPQTARVFYQHSLEERNHAMRFVQYLLNRGLDVQFGIAPIPCVINDFRTPIEALDHAVQREKQVTAQIFTLADRAEGDRFASAFIEWFVREQIEEEALFGTLLVQAHRAMPNWFDFESYVYREVTLDHAPGAPQVAGGAAS